ncbi:hypothetical protein [Porphyrobacter sp. YT40]|uniref:hypothetical protein n=1 Tax=Porphyrobacter sp. YT40 TaxID=2547601 RepID=UPI001143B338|nr:hypothetical protein [Porphyrobacter sp. YT40]QDH32956.1 hypothetical protein E2E27_00530 [Porphyrobacter sp. YT40]
MSTIRNCVIPLLWSNPMRAVVNENTGLAYYTVQAANRRHFQSLFFAVCGFTWSFALAVLVLVEDTPLGLGAGAACLASGCVLVGGSIIAHRLLLRERAAFREMITIWQELRQIAPAATTPHFRPGAMTLACAVQALTGLGLIGLGLTL